MTKNLFKLCHQAEFSIRSDGIIENFSPRQGTESARCTIFRSDAVVFFGRIPLIGRLVEGSVALPPVIWGVIEENGNVHFYSS